MAIVFLFPGQSSRYPGMLTKFAELHVQSKAVITKASEVLDRDLLHHYRADNQDAYATNQDVQIGVFLANHMVLQVLLEAGIEADASLGLSLGEWNHLVHIRALDFESALRAVEHRGRLYDEGPAGAMASVFPISLDELQEVVDRAKEGEVLEIVNLNSPRQQVLSGATAALDRALAIIEEELFCQADIIERKVPMHSSLFKGVGKHFRSYLETLTFDKPTLPYLPNRLAAFTEEPIDFPELLSTHLYHPVEWRKSIDLVVDKWPGSVFLEVGPKAVLHNMLDRKWHKGITRMKMDQLEDIRAHQEAVIAELRTITG